jgi:FkbH-like protein
LKPSTVCILACVSPNATVPVLQAQVKLVIWDLDETFWSGTLSEGGVTLDLDKIDTVKELNRRGIVSSICSKNDHDDARAELEAAGVWEQFVFPSISWSPKGVGVRAIIEDMGLRAVNVLFIDDNLGNLNEAVHYNPGLQTALPAVIDSLVDQPQLAGKDDRSLSRLHQYRVLERKRNDRAGSSGSNEDFLRASEIRVELGTDCESRAERLVELINRSNQLNYTKRRFGVDEFRGMLADPERDTRYVGVCDKYGDYGICGVYSVKNGTLTDFVFSCRILHMGVERWIYRHLGKPTLTITGDVLTGLDDVDQVDWISLDSGAVAVPEPRPTRQARVLLKGGCDLLAVDDFLQGRLVTEFNTVATSGHDVVGHHTVLIRRAADGCSEDQRAVIDRLPFLDSTAFQTGILTDPDRYEAVVYSVLQDYAQGLYRYKDGDLVVPYEQYSDPATDPDRWPYFLSRWEGVGIDRPFLEWFADNFEFLGPLSPEQFQDNIRWLRAQVPAQARLVLINGAEVEVDVPREYERHLRHQEMNAALDAVVAELPNTCILDVRPFVSERDDVVDNIRHYTRPAYLHMANGLRDLLGDELSVESRPIMIRAAKARHKFKRAMARVRG